MEVYQAEKLSKNALNAFYIVTSAMSIDVIISNIRRIQETLINTITDIHQGRLDTHLLSPQQLQEQLHLISGHLQEDLSLPVQLDDIKDLHKLLHVRAKVTNTFLIIEIKIPLTTKDHYELDYVISLPQKQNLKAYYVTPVTDYIAFNTRKDTFIPMSQIDLSSCIKYHEKGFLCELNNPIYELTNKQSICDIKIVSQDGNQTFCKIKAAECINRWVKLHSSGAWLYSCCDDCIVRILCPDGPSSLRLRGNGIVTLGQDCVIKGDSFTILGHHDYQNQIYVNNKEKVLRLPEALSPLNEYINTSLPKYQLLELEDNGHRYESIQNQLESLKNAADTDMSISIHDAHHYTMIYIILIIVCALSLGVGCYLIKQKRRSAADRRQEQQQAAVMFTRTPQMSVRLPEMSAATSLPAIYEFQNPARGLIEHPVHTTRKSEIKFKIPKLSEDF